MQLIWAISQAIEWVEIPIASPAWVHWRIDIFKADLSWIEFQLSLSIALRLNWAVMDGTRHSMSFEQCHKFQSLNAPSDRPKMQTLRFRFGFELNEVIFYFVYNFKTYVLFWPTSFRIRKAEKIIIIKYSYALFTSQNRQPTSTSSSS